MDKILIVSATEFEIKPFLEYIKTKPISNLEFLITGVGMVETTFALTQKLTSQPEGHIWKGILNVGIAGSYNNIYSNGAIVEVIIDDFSELGAEDNENFITIENLGFGKSSYKATNFLDFNLPQVKGITVNTTHGNENSIKEIENRLQPDIESMEGAAVFCVAEKLKIPAQQIRAISNPVEKRNKENWDIPTAIKNLNNWLIDFFYTQKSL